jgi:hypothetical protein
MPIIKKTKPAKRAPKTKPIKTKKPTRVLVKAKSKPTKNTLAYYQCMCHQTQQGLKGKKITGACHDCKYNSLTINAKMSARKVKDVQKLAKAHADFKQILEEYVQKH